MNVTVVMAPGWVERIKVESTPSMHRLVDTVERLARMNVAPHSRTGALLASIRSSKTINSGRIWIGTDHWPYIEYGTAAHSIHPKVKQALWWRGALHPVKHVRHPGIHAYAPMRRTLQAVKWG